MCVFHLNRDYFKIVDFLKISLYAIKFIYVMQKIISSFFARQKLFFTLEINLLYIKLSNYTCPIVKIGTIQMKHSLESTGFH